MRMKRTLAMLLSAMLTLMACVTALPKAARAAAGSAIQLGTSGIQSYSTANGYHYIYYGVYNNPVKWRVLDASNTNTSANGMFLLSDVLLGTGQYGDVEFEEYPPRTGRTGIRNVWDGSKTQVWCNSFEINNLTPKELVAIIATTKTDSAYTCNTPAGDPANPNAPASFKECFLKGDKVFFLSAAEAENGSYGLATINSRIASYSGNNGIWWLRSPLNSGGDGYAGYVKDVGNIDTQTVSSDYAARPAFNLDKSKILFSSAATGGKAGDGALAAVGTNAATEWKLTLDDSANRASFAVATGAVTATAVGSVQIPYTGAVTGTKEYISAMLVQGSGDVLYYGRIMQSTAVNGTATIAIPAGLPAGSYTLKVFNEQYNGDKMTDYASAFRDINLTVTAAGGDSGDLGADVPKTGDGAPLGLLASFVLLSGAGLAVSAAGKRRAAKRR